MKRIVICVLFAAATMVVPAKANAASIAFILDCTVISQTQCTAGGNFGTVTLNDNGNLVDVTIDMAGGLLPHVLSLNWNTAVYGALPTAVLGANWTTTVGASVLKSDTNNAGAFSRFDISVWDNVGGLTDPLTFSLGHQTYNGGNLDVAMFIAKDDQTALYAAVKVGTVVTPSSGTPCSPTSPNCYGAQTAVPEPGTLGLLGVGLLAAAGAARRKLRKS